MAKSEKRTVPVLVLGNGLTVLGVMRCLGRKRIPLFCLSEGMTFERRSRWCRSLGPGVGTFATSSDLERVLESLPLESGALIACSDHWTIEATRISAAFKNRFCLCLPETDVLGRFVDKGRFSELLDAAQVPHPFTLVAKTDQEVIEAAKRSGGGLFLKPTESQRFLQKFGRKAFRIDDVAKAVAIFNEAREAGLGVMVQEYIPGSSDRHYFVDGFVDRTHRVHAVFARRRIRMYPPDFGNSSYMVSVPLEEVADAVNTLRTLFETARYRGIFSAEFKLDERDGRFKILEVNCRPWWYIQFAAECGVDVVEMAYCDALGLALPPFGAYKAGVRLVFAYYDFQALREARGSGIGVLSGIAGSWPLARTPIFAWDDPGPAIADFGERLKGRLTRFVGRPGV